MSARERYALFSCSISGSIASFALFACTICLLTKFVCVHDPSAGFVCALDMLRKARTYAVCSATHVTYFLDYSMNCLFTPEL